MNFSEAKMSFDKQYKSESVFQCFLYEHLTPNKSVKIKTDGGKPNEQYYKWEFLYSVVTAGLFSRDYIGTEIHFPKGNKSSAPLKMDAAIFDDNQWFHYYKKYHSNHEDLESLDWLRNHLLVAIEFKKEDSKSIAEVWDKQLKAYMKESSRSFCLGVLYDTGRMYLFSKFKDKYLRLDESLNMKGENSSTKYLSLHLPDPYIALPNFKKLINWGSDSHVDRTNRSITDLDIISGVHTTQLNDAMSAILRMMDRVGLADQKGFDILVQILALKIFDEKRNEDNPNRKLDFYITNDEKRYSKISDTSIQQFLTRINNIRNEATETYYRILKDNVWNPKNINHLRLLVEIVSQFQDYSFRRSQKTDLYQLVFYKFATPFSKTKNAQFITPLALIDFLVSIVNPRNGETVIDPTVGIADFLSVSYVNSNSKLDDHNIFGMDIDEDMVKLATLNMLLNGDGNARIEAKTGYGSLLTKFDKQGGTVELEPQRNKNGNWDDRSDDKEIKKFDVVLTNPPFGEDRAFKPKEDKDFEVIQCYEMWSLYGNNPNNNNEEKKKGTNKKQANKIDLGVVFLENAYRLLRDGGRMGIVLSNSIASIDTHKIARKWLLDKMRIVAIFDLPANVFAETGVNTSIIVAYKPKKTNLAELKDLNYQVFAKDIKKVGYEVKTSKRVKYFCDKYKINYETFKIEIDQEGNPLKDEEFSETICEFRNWCYTQEEELQELFIMKK